MDVSFVIPVYNASDLIEDSIRSLLEQDFTGSYEIIAVDDCSTDGTPAILGRLAAGSDGRMKVLRTPVNSGYPTAMNIGIAAARGRYIARQDSDDLSHPSRLSIQFRLHEAHPEAAFVSCMRYWLTVNGKPFHAPPNNGPEVYRETWQDLVDQKRRFTDPACLFLRECSLAIGGYNTYLRTGMDVDHWLRLMEYTGQPCLNVNLPIYGRRLIPNSLIYKAGTTYSNSIPRLFAKYRVEHGLPPETRPTAEWLEEVRQSVPPAKGEFRKVRLVMDTALVNLKMGDLGGFLSFFRVALSRNPVSALRFLAGALFRWDFTDRIAGVPPVERKP